MLIQKSLARYEGTSELVLRDSPSACAARLTFPSYRASDF